MLARKTPPIDSNSHNSEGRAWSHTFDQTTPDESPPYTMARPTWRVLLIVCVLSCGVLLGYRLACCSAVSTNLFSRQSNGGSGSSISDSKSDSNSVPSLSHSQFVTRQHVIGVENATAQPTCRRFWQGGKSEWFDGKFKPSLLPVWMKENTELSEAVAKWWTHLQSNTDKDYVTALNKAFEVIPNPERFLTRNLSNCFRCAVVGNSGNLRGSGYGTLIDSHDAVVRINQAKVKGFETDVGKKEDYRLMYPESYTDIPAEANFVLLNFKVLDIRWATSALTTGEITKTYTSVKSKIKVPPSKVLFYNPELMWHIYHNWIDRKGRYPSSGPLGIFFALQFCDEVSVFGLGANSKGYWDHYWQKDDGAKNSAFLKTHVHDSIHELEVITKLAEEKIITLYKGVR